MVCDIHIYTYVHTYIHYKLSNVDFRNKTIFPMNASLPNAFFEVGKSFKKSLF